MTDSARLRRAFVLTAKALCPGSPLVLWAPADQPRLPSTDPRDVVTCRIARGPTPGNSIECSSDEPLIITLVIANTIAEGQRVLLQVGGQTFYEDAGAGDTAADVRDRLAAQLTATALPGVTVTTGSVGLAGWGSINWSSASWGEQPGATLTLDASGVPGLLWDPAVWGPAALAVTDSTPAEATLSRAGGVVEVQAYAAGRHLEAHDILNRFVAGLPTAFALDIRSACGVAFHDVGEIIDITTLATGDWESRAATRVTFSMRSYAAFAADTIGYLEYSINDGYVAGSLTL